MRVMQSKFIKNNSKNIFKGGGGGRAPAAPVLDPPLFNEFCINFTPESLIDFILGINKVYKTS